jgi:hypothetical protein
MRRRNVDCLYEYKCNDNNDDERTKFCAYGLVERIRVAKCREKKIKTSPIVTQAPE